MSVSDAFLYFFAYIFILGLIFLVFRDIICWYWKINQNLALLTEIRDLLTKSVAAQKTAVPFAISPDGVVHSVAPPNADASCPKSGCGAPVRRTDTACWKCGADFANPHGWKPIPAKA